MTLEKYNLTWHTYPDHLKGMMKDLMENNNFADVTLICEDKKKIRAHKNILSACSPILKDILSADKSVHCNIYLRGVFQNYYRQAPIRNRNHTAFTNYIDKGDWHQMKTIFSALYRIDQSLTFYAAIKLSHIYLK